MTHHLVVLTVDTDPDGLNGAVANRQSLSWAGLAEARELPHDLARHPAFSPAGVPITWFVRADGQLEDVFGTPLYLLDAFANFWEAARGWGHELGWHPHLYRQPPGSEQPIFLTDARRAAEELERLWEQIQAAGMTFGVFRNGEGWHTPETFATVERLGLRCDSTAIPGRGGPPGHPREWTAAPQQPYFPDPGDVRRAGPARPLLEIPMSTRPLRAPYDPAPRPRYLDPAVHPGLFDASLGGWRQVRDQVEAPVCVWVLILHPDEVLPALGPDQLYARSRAAVCRNLARFVAGIQERGESYELVTLSEAGRRWRLRMGAAA